MIENQTSNSYIILSVNYNITSISIPSINDNNCTLTDNNLLALSLSGSSI